MNVAYCFKCKSKQDIKEQKQKQNAKGRWYLSGACAVCGTKMNKFIKPPGSPQDKKEDMNKVIAEQVEEEIKEVKKKRASKKKVASSE